jgi:hypothetical protein
MLFDIGVIGYVEDNGDRSENAIYEMARFHYNSVSKITFANDRVYCVHPVFSGTWNLRRSGHGDGEKFVYPADVGLDVWQS